MYLPDTQIALLYQNEIYRRMATNQPVSLFEFNYITNLLVFIGIPYDVKFDSGTRKEAAAFELTVHINPTKTEVFVVSLQQGQTVFVD